MLLDITLNVVLLEFKVNVLTFSRLMPQWFRKKKHMQGQIDSCVNYVFVQHKMYFDTFSMIPGKTLLLIRLLMFQAMTRMLGVCWLLKRYSLCTSISSLQKPTKQVNFPWNEMRSVCFCPTLPPVWNLGSWAKTQHKPIYGINCDNSHGSEFYLPETFGKTAAAPC